MCDIVDINCHAFGCTNKTNVHIGDYSVQPDSLNVFCGEHQEEADKFIRENSPCIVFTECKTGETFVTQLPRSIYRNY